MKTTLLLSTLLSSLTLSSFAQATPDTVANLVYWLDADNGITRTEDGAVSRWEAYENPSPTPPYAAQNTVANRPIFSPNGSPSSRGTLVFDGSNDSLTFDSKFETTTQALTLFAVVSIGNLDQSGFLLDTRNGGANLSGINIRYEADLKGLRMDVRQNTSVGAITRRISLESALPDYSANEFFLIMAHVDPTAGPNGQSVITFDVSGVRSTYTTPADSITNITDSYAMTLGNTNTGTNYWNGSISSVIRYDRALNSTEIESVSTYLTDRYLAIPEPGSVSLLMLGCATLPFLRRIW